jgi:hypothetical protein
MILKSKSTLTARLIIQSIILRGADINTYTFVASIDLTAVFDLVNTKLQIKCLKIIDLPSDIV